MSSVSPPVMEPAALLRLQVFSPHVDSGFKVLRGSEWVTLSLDQATAAAGADPGAESFSLIFAGGPEKALQQGMHEFQHPALGTFELFIVPIMCPHPEVRWYQAVINS